MEQLSEATSQPTSSTPVGDPLTDYDSKMVALRAERHDEIQITEVESELRPGAEYPETFTVAQRTETYYGPKLLLDSGAENYLLTAPGPDSQLLLWEAERGADGFRKGWCKLAEIRVEFGESLPQYDLCPYCSEPLKTLEHERMAGFGECPEVTSSD